ncbi:chromosome partitioning protein ParB [Novosphingobium barchaimii LL02]|uniref:Chromosome partitioning protein ParB n=1 Tax=Novosphingobium barchaimii LL02 TaxID=1114963 RepID=A0A0J7XXR4_9SPHN|nr:ParB/RepB/Spo0J family partition protein [Novosphingobium barchaimii]KMS56028.1 chromosome partitioning protein ParB [Novosphingobium barchaimii LL02]
MIKPALLIPASHLAKSLINVRKRADPRADAELEASIAAHGLLQNLVGVPVSRKKGHYRITAGGRRLDAIHRLIEKGRLRPDHEVPVLILSNTKDGREVSLAENFERQALSPAEDCLAFRDLIEVEKLSPADIARRFGIEERFVLGRLRLANLADPIFAALEGGEITLDVAKAYATTADTGRQMAVWESLRTGYARDNVNEIRRALKTYSYRADDPRALLVGRDAYVGAGGRVEDRDLFSAATDERWIDTHILDDLAAEKLAAQAEVIRQPEGLGEVRVVAAEHPPYMATFALQPLSGTFEPLSGEQEARRQEIEAEIAGIYLRASDETEGDEAQRYAQLQAELGAITERKPEIDAEQKASALGDVVLKPDGTPQLYHQLYVAPAADTGSHESDDEDAEPADGLSGCIAAVDTAPAMTQRLREMLAMMKYELLAVHVANDPTFALDLGTFLMVEREHRLIPCIVPSDLYATAPQPLLAEFKPETTAAAEWRRFEEALDRSWAGYSGLEERYDAFCALDDEARAAWLGWAIARTLHAVPDGRDGTDFLNHLGRKLGIDVAAWWRPTALTFFDKLTRPGILSLFEQIGGEELRVRYSGLKKHDLAASAERLFGGDLVIEPEIQARAVAWLPDQMRFGPAEEEADADVCADAGVDDDAADCDAGMTDRSSGELDDAVGEGLPRAA